MATTSTSSNPEEVRQVATGDDPGPDDADPRPAHRLPPVRATSSIAPTLLVESRIDRWLKRTIRAASV